MKFMLVYGRVATISIGGGQTLVLRLARGLREAGHDVSVVFFDSPSDDLKESIDHRIRCLVVPRELRRGFLFPINCRRWLAEKCGQTDICVGAGSGGLHFVAANGSAFSNAPPLIVLIVGDTNFTGANAKQVFSIYTRWHFQRYFDRYLPDKCKFFMNDAVRRLHEVRCGRLFTQSRITPLPIFKANRLESRQSPFRLVSIGRVDPGMKSYNFTMPQILKELVDEGVDFQWDVYGGGRTEMLREHVQRHGIAGRVGIHGLLPYSQFEAVLKHASAFVGMGTAALEAAMLGIPSIVAVAWSREPVCMGHVHEIPFGIVGEASAYWVDRRTIKEAIRNIWSLEDNDYKTLCEKDRTAAMKYELSILIPSFIEYCTSAVETEMKPYPLAWSIANCINIMRHTYLGKKRIIIGGDV